MFDHALTPGSAVVAPWTGYEPMNHALVGVAGVDSGTLSPGTRAEAAHAVEYLGLAGALRRISGTRG